MAKMRVKVVNRINWCSGNILDLMAKATPDEKKKLLQVATKLEELGREMALLFDAPEDAGGDMF